METNTELTFVKKNVAMSKATTLLKIRTKSYEKMKWKTRHIKSERVYKRNKKRTEGAKNDKRRKKKADAAEITCKLNTITEN